MSSNILVPELGESIVDARVARWLKNEGDRVSTGDPLVELETDKIDVEVSAPQTGILRRIDQRDGADVKIGEVLGVIEDAAGAAAGDGGVEVVSGPREDGQAKATPSARKLARQHQVSLAQVPGTGDAGRVTRRDVETYIAERPGPSSSAPATSRPAPVDVSPTASTQIGAARPETPAVAREVPASRDVPPVPPAPVAAPAGTLQGERREERVRMSRRRLTIARRLVEAQHAAAMLTTFNEIDMTAVMQLRERRKQAFKERYGVSLGIASFFVKAAVGALREFPRINAEINGDETVLKHYYDIGIAVGAEGGLVVPVLRDADRLSFPSIELTIREFARRAGDGSLTLEDLRGGTFTITNGGVFGSLLSTPILNPPQVAILGLHKIEERPVAVGGQVEIRPMMYVALSYDHRIVDGRESVQFLARVKELVEDPAALLLEV
jgi:2-oxoglutarate dehydrogenase E2 component (dihydrolipoamide succinyltransferase)